MRIALAQLNYIIGDFQNNVLKIKENIRKAKTEKAKLIVFAELCICAYPPQDFLEFKDFIQRCRDAALDIAKECVGITAIVGLPTINPKTEGKYLFNSAMVLKDGAIVDTVHKSLLPTYDIFDEYRYFEPNRNFHCIKIDGVAIALTICEDLWNVEDDPNYVSCPMESLIAEQPGLMINIAASPFNYEHAEQRKAILLRNVKQYHLPLLYVNHVGAQTEIIFDGGSMAFDKNGNLIEELNYFSEDLRYIDYNVDSQQLSAAGTIDHKKAGTKKIERIHDALIMGVRDYFQKLGFKQAILGLSGGIDSALVATLAASALGPKNVKAVMMPSKFSSKGSVDHSVELIKNLGIDQELISIEPVMEKFLDSLEPQFAGLESNVTEENIQARIRGVLLMALSNKFGYILLNTSNKSEMAVGYGTLYGDMCGGLSVIGDLYKTEVYELCNYINRNGIIIPKEILIKAPSAELRHDQKDSDSLPEYDVLDKVLYEYIEERKGPDELIKEGFDASLVRRVLKMVNTNEYKRFQTPPILRISPKAFGMGRRMPIVGKYLS
ncbi:MAG: NAD+ synthase [Bacteroidetes bacterium]|nr:MAG: NAD+ synthase [Bacteroidota bacterium]